MAAFSAPIVNGVRNAFAREDFREAIGGAALLPWTGTGDQMNVACGQLLVVPRIGQVGEVVDWVVEIKVVVV